MNCNSSFWNKYSQQLSIIVENSQQIGNNKNALEYINKCFVDQIYPPLKNFVNEAEQYSKLRDEENNKINEKIKNIYSDIDLYLKKLPYKIETRIMSSIAARLNLIKDFDLDIGILVEDLNQNSITEISEYLQKDGFKFAGITNPTSVTNTYHSYQKNIYGIEVEVKIRDKNFSQIIVELHDYLDNELTEQERSLLTFAKYQLKQYNRTGYTNFKKLIYEYAFSVSNKENGFLFVMN